MGAGTRRKLDGACERLGGGPLRLDCERFRLPLTVEFVFFVVLLCRLLQADCIQLEAEELEPLKRMSCLQRLSLSGLGKLTDAVLLQVGSKLVCRAVKYVAQHLRVPAR